MGSFTRRISLSNALKSYTIPESSELYLTIENNTYQIQNNKFVEVTSNFTILDQEQIGENTILSEVIDTSDNRYKIVTVNSSLKGWSFSQTLSSSQFAKQQTLYIALIILVSFIVVSLGIGLTYYLNILINKPLSKINNKIRLIAQGDFSRDPYIEWPNELGEIGHGINTLAKEVVQLMDKRIEDEKEKNDLEYKILQSQINPHFLYNTLNSIKWMATIQNADGIAEMTTSLARLMKYVSKDPHQIHTLKDEIALLNDYFVIQKYRYGGTISLFYNIESEDLYDCQILKFSLQPMVENAIFHGIEPKGAIGHIEVHIHQDNDERILIDIKDDGIGMTDDQIQKALSGEADLPSDLFKKIGIDNVNRRIKYTFGSQYGLSITSVLGHHTTMSITLPYIRMNGHT